MDDEYTNDLLQRSSHHNYKNRIVSGGVRHSWANILYSFKSIRMYTCEAVWPNGTLNRREICRGRDGTRAKLSETEIDAALAGKQKTSIRTMSTMFTLLYPFFSTRGGNYGKIMSKSTVRVSGTASVLDFSCLFGFSMTPRAKLLRLLLPAFIFLSHCTHWHRHQ